MEIHNAQIVQKEENVFHCIGTWSVLVLDGLIQSFQQFKLPKKTKVDISGASLESIDSAGALALMECIDKLKQNDNQVILTDFSDAQRELLDLIISKKDALTYVPTPPKKMGLLYNLGKEFINKLLQIDGLIILIGDLSTKLFKSFGHWKRLQVPSIISIIYSAGVQALPIIGLLSFLIGIVLAYQMGLQLETYGANSFISFLTGLATFREFSPLITAIIVAGRTSSAFTAQLGSMKINEEVDALLTMGLSPTQLLVMPKVVGLILVFPLLIFWSDVFSILGAMVMSKGMLDIGYIDYLQRLRSSVGLEQMMLGLYKAPAFALIISLVGCFQGFAVKANADSIGSQTTKSVVQALFLIIIADAAFSVVYSWMSL